MIDLASDPTACRGVGDRLRAVVTIMIVTMDVVTIIYTDRSDEMLLEVPPSPDQPTHRLARRNSKSTILPSRANGLREVLYFCIRIIGKSSQLLQSSVSAL